MMKPKTKSKPGVSLYLTIMVLSLILGLAFSLNTLLLIQTRSLRNIGNSVIAFAATETGIEKALYDIKTTGSAGPWIGTLTINNASYSVRYFGSGVGGCPATASNYCLESIGTYKDVKRGIRIAR